MLLSCSALEPIPCRHALPTSGFILVRSTKVTSSPSQNPSPPCPNRSRRGRLVRNLLLRRFARNHLNNISRIKSENTFLIHLLNVLRIPLIIGMILQIILNDIIKRCIFNSCCDLLTAFYAIALFIFYELGQASSAETMVARLDAYWTVHDLEAEGAGYFVFYGLGQSVYFGLLSLLFFLLFLFLGLLLFLLLLFLFGFWFRFGSSFLQLLRLLLWFFLLRSISSKKLEPKPQRLRRFNFRSRQQPDLHSTFNLKLNSLANLSILNIRAIGAQIGQDYFLASLLDLAMLRA